MTLWQCYLQGWKGYVKFAGRATRKEFWVFTLGNIVLMILLVMGTISFFSMAGDPYIGVLYAGMAYSLFALVLALPLLAVGIRRMHDIGRSGWWFGGVYLAGVISRMLNMILVQYASPETYAVMNVVLGIILGWIPLLGIIYLCYQKSKTSVDLQKPVIAE